MSVRKQMSIVAVVTCLGLSAAAPGNAEPSAVGDPVARLTMTSPALVTLDAGDLAVEPIGPTTDAVATRSARRAFSMPVSEVVYNRQGRVRSVLLTGGLRVVGEGVSVDLTQLQVRIASRRATVRVSDTTARVPAFDVARLKVTKRAVSGVLVIAPGTSAVLNERFDTYVFVDGLRFVTFQSRL